MLLLIVGLVVVAVLVLGVLGYGLLGAVGRLRRETAALQREVVPVVGELQATLAAAADARSAGPAA